MKNKNLKGLNSKILFFLYSDEKNKKTLKQIRQNFETYSRKGIYNSLKKLKDLNLINFDESNKTYILDCVEFLKLINLELDFEELEIKILQNNFENKLFLKYSSELGLKTIFEEYEKIRLSGLYNMYDYEKILKNSWLSKTDLIYVQTEYKKLKKKY